ncbi:unnamed protein product [Meloidogyne enterolobii]|uniref:Uncharacterized protein n=1 Tax=Meloidogyne enterolobii TaxID=390850 RepID=A0ACB0ZQW0_MELEN
MFCTRASFHCYFSAILAAHCFAYPLLITAPCRLYISPLGFLVSKKAVVCEELFSFSFWLCPSFIYFIYSLN